MKKWKSGVSCPIQERSFKVVRCHKVGWARAVRAPLEVNQGRFAALARVDRDDEQADAPLPMEAGEEQEEQPRQRRWL